MRPRRIDIFPTADDLMSAAAAEVCRIVRGSVRERGACTLMLSGGETPRGLYRRLAALPRREAPDWSRVHLCFGDERMVSPDDAESNYGMVRDELIAKIPIRAGNVHRIRGERSHETASREYSSELEGALSHTGGRCDLILLGLGTDGHTASLFPGTEALRETERTVCDLYVPRLSVWRVTITLRVINNAREILFLVSGAGKSEVIRRVFGAESPTPEIPATLVAPQGTDPHWMLDAAAGSMIPPES